MTKLSIQDFPIKNKKVLLRVDFNVPLNNEGEITDDSRIQAALPTIEYIINQCGTPILLSHLGRPKGKRNPKFSLAPCAKRLSELLQKPVLMARDCIGPEVQEMVKLTRPGDVILLENLRFYEAEEDPEKDPTFADQLAELGDIYVNDAFGTAHRNHSSIVPLAKKFPNAAATGFLLEREIAFLGNVVQHPKRPFYAIIGGAKVSSKAGVLKNLIERIDGLFVGGGMAFTFFKAQGIEVGDSLLEETLIEVAKEIITICQERAVKFWLPIDLIIANAFDNQANTKVIAAKDGIPKGWMGVDIGPKTAEEWEQSLQGAATIFWNGPLGVFEMPNFSKGTKTVAAAVANSTATTIVGGGDSIAAINQLGIQDRFTHLSTGGGALIEYVEHGHLPGIDALCNR